jgi:hypothetical protein
MKSAEILAQIKPCDMDSPYIFISYSARDHARVWEDALLFQRLGYNIWLDERNLDKTKESWTDDALAAISDLDCKLLLFYVSSASLTSEACYRELHQTKEKLTMQLHFGPVPFVAVDVENVGNIGEFTQSVYNSLMRERISKQEKSAKAIVLSNFTDQFFNSNNERVRIHPKDEPNRRSSYYADIVAAFPNSAQYYTPEITLEELSHPGDKRAAEPSAPEADPIPAKPTDAVETAPEPPAPTPEQTAEVETPVEVEAPQPPRESAQPETPAPSLADQIMAQLGRKTEPVLQVTQGTLADEPDEDADSSDTPEEQNAAVDTSNADLMARIAQLLRTQSTAAPAETPTEAELEKPVEKPAPEVPTPGETPAPPAEGANKPSLEEMIRRQLENQKKK